MKAAVVAIFLGTMILSVSGNEISRAESAEQTEHKEYIIIVNDRQAQSHAGDIPIETTEEELMPEISDDEFQLLTVVVEAEAGSCSEECRRAVADVILNRAGESGSIKETVYAPGQFSCVWDGGIERHSVPSEETVRICREELREIRYSKLWYFRSGHYHKHYGTPVFSMSGMYFSER